MNERQMTFTPVRVERGRKFRGHGYYLGYESTFSSPGGIAYYSKLWDPVALKVVYANSNFCEEDQVPPEKIEADKAAYVKATIQDQLARSVDANGTNLQWARNALLRYHPEMRDEIEKAIPDQRDVVAEIERTLQWASNLKSRPCVIYGKPCPGGKPYPDIKKVRMAYWSLVNKGVSKLEGFKEAWDLLITMSGLKIPKDIRAIMDGQGEPAGNTEI